MAADLEDFEPWLSRWALTPEGPAFSTPFTASRLLPVRRGGAAAMLKIARTDEERRGAATMVWWAGNGAAEVLAHDGDALLLERAQGDGDLAEIARHGRDDEAMRIICDAIAALHAPREAPPPPMISLEQLFRALREAASGDSRLDRAKALAAELLRTPREEVVLHGDMHHFNVLDFAARGWLAIDPWGVVGERAYDYANLVRNPDLATAIAPGRFRQQVDHISRLAGLEPHRLALWSYAHAGLSAAWQIEDGQDPAPNFQIMDVFAAALGEGTG